MSISICKMSTNSYVLHVVFLSVLLSILESVCNAVVSSLRTVPKPGYGLKAATLPAAGRNGGPAGMVVSFLFFLLPYFVEVKIRTRFVLEYCLNNFDVKDSKSWWYSLLF